MCGVVGYASECVKSGVLDILTNIFWQSKVRGLHATGYSYWDGNNPVTNKFRTFVELRMSLSALWPSFVGAPLRLIGHTRYSTSGDWHNPHNNQPLAIEDMALVFNGCIHMGTRLEYGAVYGEQYTTDNDGEIFCRKVLAGEDWESFVARGRFSFAGLFLRAGSVHGVRNAQRPLWAGVFGGDEFVASTRDIFKRSGFPGYVLEVEPAKSFKMGPDISGKPGVMGLDIRAGGR
jgi:glutamine phosphoribosylpyrophosphate amidotransferase